jgi:diguanylate cyclase (GGDEF)-like protein
MEALFRAEDIPCRFGGEEFVVILPGADADTAAQRAEQLRHSAEALVVRYLEQDLPRISVSIGVAVFPEAGDTPEAVLKAADDALYRAKANGRNRVELAAHPVGGPPSAEPTAIAEVPTKPLVVAAED